MYRPHLVAYLTVNAAVIDLKTFGTKELKDYNDFKQLVDKINDIVSFELEDEIICDFGEIKIQFKDKFYPVFVGTGNNFLIPFYENLDILDMQSYRTIEDARHISCPPEKAKAIEEALRYYNLI